MRCVGGYMERKGEGDSSDGQKCQKLARVKHMREELRDGLGEERGWHYMEGGIIWMVARSLRLRLTENGMVG
ncbi:hypothetical protein AN958_00037 [Leucoagaricus sp. SymC.cos]|nr:hypothetical protein AN958_00037 [Leucoagaricus sp. SymC.cos]